MIASKRKKLNKSNQEGKRYVHWKLQKPCYKKIKKNKWKDIQCSRFGSLNIVKMFLATQSALQI